MIQCKPNCDEKHKVLKVINGFEIVQCSECEHRFTSVATGEDHVSKYYGNSYFFEGENGGYPNYLDQTELLVKRGERYAHLLQGVGGQGNKLLDVGSAAGFILKGLTDSGWIGTGIEPNKVMADYAKNEFKLNVQQSTLENFTTNEKFDCVTMIQVIAHFYDLEKAMVKVHSLLNEKGMVLIESWNRNSLTAKIFRWKWHEYSPPTVIHWFSPGSLTRMMKICGFKLIRKGRKFKRISMKHAKSLISQKFNYKIIKVLLRLIPDKIKLIYPSEDLFYVIYQKQ